MKKLISIVLIMLVLSSQTIFAFSDSNDNYNSNKITIEEATKAALHFLDNTSAVDSEWTYDSIGEPQLLMDYSGNKDVYIVPVIYENETKGYITISATRNKMPIIEASLSKPPTERIDEIKQEVLKTIGVNRKFAKINIYYAGPLSYVAELSIDNDNDKVDKLYYDIKSKTFLQTSDVEKLKTIDENKPKEAREAWNKILEVSKDNTLVANIVTDSSKTYIMKSLSVPVYNQWDVPSSQTPGNKCGPTAGAMILEYWRLHGYVMIDGTDMYSVPNLIVHLAGDMNTPSWGTSVSGWRNGLIYHTNSERSYHFSTTTTD